MGLISWFKCKIGAHDFKYEKTLSSQVVKVFCKGCKKYYVVKLKGEFAGTYVLWDSKVEEFYNMLYELAKEKYNEDVG